MRAATHNALIGTSKLGELSVCDQRVMRGCRSHVTQQISSLRLEIANRLEARDLHDLPCWFAVSFTKDGDEEIAVGVERQPGWLIKARHLC